VTFGAKSTFTDATGHFVLDSVPLGRYRAQVEHERLDTLGLAAVMSVVDVRGPMDSVRLATPSMRTLWSHFCPGDVPYDSGFVFGVVRKPMTHQPAPKEAIVASWTELIHAGSALSQKEYRLESTTADDGAYALCSLPVDAVVHIASGSDTSAVAGLDVALSRATPMRRHDITLTDAKVRGIVRGIITSSGKPLGNARVSIGTKPEVRTNNAGRFVIPDAPIGTQQIDIQAIGFTPASRVVEISPGDTSTLQITLDKAVVLDSVVVKTGYRARLASEFEERRKRGLGQFRDSTQMQKYSALEGVFIGMPSVVTRRPRAGGDLAIQVGTCAALVFVDGMRSNGMLSALRPDDLAAIEVYRAGEMPRDLAGRLGLHQMKTPCALVAWTKNYMR
jgi:hypothetical protein